MSHLEQYQLRVYLCGLHKDLKAKLDDLAAQINKLPYCPCCPGQRELCGIDWMRLPSIEDDCFERVAAGAGIPLDHLKEALEYKRTLTEEEYSSYAKYVQSILDKQK